MPFQPPAPPPSFHLLKSGAVLSEPMRDVLIDLLSRTIVAAPSTPAAVRLIQGGSLKAGSSFPHLVEWNGALSEEDEACEWQQQKTKLTRITVQLRNQRGALPPHPCPHASHLVHVRSCLISSWYPVPVAGEKVKGSTLQVGGLVLQLTLHNATTMQLLSDNDKPAKTRALGVLTETKANKSARLELPLMVRLTESSHTFKFHVMLLSSDISGALIKIKVSPPNADAGDPLCVVTRAFMSRARFDEQQPMFTSLTAEDEQPTFRSLSAGGDDEDSNQDEDADKEDEDGHTHNQISGALIKIK